MTLIDVQPQHATELAQELLALANDLELPASVVRTTSDGLFGLQFDVPDELATLLFGSDPKPLAELESEEEPVVEAEESTLPEPKKRGRPKKAVDAALPKSEPEE